MNVIEEEITALIQQQDLITKQILAVISQKRQTLNDGDRPRLEEQEKDLKCKYDECTQKIEQLRTGVLPPLTAEKVDRLKAELRNEWESQLHWLDYHKHENQLHKLVRVEGQDAVLLLIQHRIRMKADLYIKRIRGHVLDDGRLRPVTEDFSNEGRMDPRRFIELWQDKLHTRSSTPGFEAAVQEVIQTLENSVIQGQTLYLEIRVQQLSDGFLGWFLEAFWQPLVNALSRRQRGINLIGIVTTEAALEQRQMQEGWCCKIKQFDRDKYLEVKLEKWSQKDIERWISRYLNGSLDKRSLPPQNATRVANRVYADSERGTPLHAHNYILHDILTQVVDELPRQHHATS